MKIEIRHLWRYKWGGRTVTSRIKMTREQILREHPEAQLIEGSAEEFHVFDQVCEVDAQCVCLGKHGGDLIFLSQLHRPRSIPQEPDTVPLPLAPTEYDVRQAGDVWTVTTRGSYGKEVYRGPGPVRVERSP